MSLKTINLRVPDSFVEGVTDIQIQVPVTFVLTANGVINIRVPGEAATPAFITVDASGAPAGHESTVAWTLTPDPGDGNGSGTGSSGPFEVPANVSPGYTLIWEDSLFDYEPPAAEGPTPLDEGASHTFELT